MDKLAAMDIFVTLMNCGSFARTAETFGISEGVAAQATGQLESQLGVKLLELHYGEIVPTEAGLQYYKYAQIALDAARNAGLL